MKIFIKIVIYILVNVLIFTTIFLLIRSRNYSINKDDTGNDYLIYNNIKYIVEPIFKGGWLPIEIGSKIGDVNGDLFINYDENALYKIKGDDNENFLFLSYTIKTNSVSDNPYNILHEFRDYKLPDFRFDSFLLRRENIIYPEFSRNNIDRVELKKNDQNNKNDLSGTRNKKLISLLFNLLENSKEKIVKDYGFNNGPEEELVAYSDKYPGLYYYGMQLFYDEKYNSEYLWINDENLMDEKIYIKCKFSFIEKFDTKVKGK